MAATQHRKIDLQSPHDLTHLYSLALLAATDRVNAAFPATADEDEDPLQKRVAELVEEYIHRTYASALPSLTVAGLDAHPLYAPLVSPSTSNPPPSATDDAYEPFDAALASRLQALHARLETLRSQTAILRREAPAAAAGRWQDSFRAVLDAEEQAVQDADATKLAEAEAEAAQLDWTAVSLGAGEEQRKLELTRAWDRGVRGMVELKGEKDAGLTATAARVRRGVEAVRYLTAD